MPRAVLIFAVLAAMLATGPAAFAQSEDIPSDSARSESTPAVDPDEEANNQRIARWNRVLDRVDGQLNAEGLSLANLSILEETVGQVRDQVSAAKLPFQREVKRIGDLLEALGPPSAEGEPPETENVTAQRVELNRLLSLPQGRLRQLNVLTQRTRLLMSRIDQAEVRIVRAQLLVRTPSLLSAETWAGATAEFVEALGRILAAPREWYNSPQVAGVVGKGYLASLLLGVVAAAVLGWVLGRWLIRHFGRKPAIEDPSFRKRVLAAVAEATANTLIPILVMAVAYVALLGRGLLFGLFEQVVVGIIAAVICVSVMRGLPRAMLSPTTPHWRLTLMGDQAARLWVRRALTLGILAGIDLLMFYPLEYLQPSLLLRYTYVFVNDGVIAAVFLAVVFDNRLWRMPGEEARTTMIKAGESPGSAVDDSARRSRWWRVGRLLVAALSLAIPISGLAGYGVLSEEIAIRLRASVGILLVALVLHGLARDLVAVFTREDQRPPGPDDAPNPLYVWSVLLLDIGLVVSVMFFMVPLWGRWDTIVERIGWILSGVKIGGYTFSLTDLLMGMVIFAVLIILVRFFQRFLDNRILRQTRMDVGVRDALKTGVGYVGVVLAGLIAINTAGIDLSGLAIIAGALSVGIGFGMQSIVNNFVSGLILLIERPIKVGDWVVVGQDEGYVRQISVRSTQIQTFSNASVIVPNSELIAGRVTNWMYKDRSGRVELTVGVAYGSDTAKVRDILLDCAKGNDRVKAWPQPRVVFMDFGDSALIFQLRFFVGNIDERLSVSSDLRFAIDAAFREAGISIPFPQRDVHIIKDSEQAFAAEAKPEEPVAQPSGKVLPINPGRHADDDPGIEQDSEN